MKISPLPENFNFHICGVDEVHKYKDEFITDIIAFTHPGNQNEASYDDFNFSPIINKFCVHDVFDDRYHSDGLKWPDEKLIKEIISVCNDIKKKVDENELVNCLIHCQAGISRSTAAAFILLSILTGEWKERDCINEIYHRRSIMHPNPLMVSIADKLLDRKGKMVDLIDHGEDREQDILLF